MTEPAASSGSSAAPDAARLARFMPPAGPVASGADAHGDESDLPPDSDGTAPPLDPSPEASAAPSASARPVTWDEWSRLDRDRRERHSLITRLRGDRGAKGLAHAEAVIAHRSRVRAAAVGTLAAALPLAAGWITVIRARNASIEQGMGDRSFAPFGFLLLIVTVVAVVTLLRWWSRVLRGRPDPLHFDPFPDSPDAPRHGAFDGSSTPPTRW